WVRRPKARGRNGNRRAVGVENTKMSLDDVANDPSLFDALPSTERAALYEEVVGLDAWLKARLLTKPGPGLFEFFQGDWTNMPGILDMVEWLMDHEHEVSPGLLQIEVHETRSTRRKG